MRYYLLFIFLNLAAILAYTDFDEKGKIQIEKMKNHMREIRTLLRNLDTSDEDDEEDLSDDEYSSDSDEYTPPQTNATTTEPTNSTTTEPTNSTTTEPTTEPTTTPTTTPATQKPVTGKKSALVQLITFNSFKAPPAAPKITFNTFFTFINVRPPRFVIIMISINIRRMLRNLEDEVETKPANCTIAPEDALKEDGNVRYECDAPKQVNDNVTEVAVLNVSFPEGTSLTMDDVNFSEEAALAGTQLSKQTMEISKIFRLNGGKLSTYPSYFTISGTIDDKDFTGNFESSPLVLEVVDNETTPSTSYNVSCTPKSNGNNNYEFRCTPETGVKGTIYLSTIKYGDKAISLNMTEGDYINYATTSTTIPTRGKTMYRKSSSGLSGGAIAGIVIACAVVLIIASILAIMLRKVSTPTAPFQNQTPSIVGLRSVDNYSQ